MAIIDKLGILDELFDRIYLPEAVWEELTRNKTTEHYSKVAEYCKEKVKGISGFNELTFIMDPGESESVILYKELNADFLLIDDKKARNIAENFGIQCIGTIGILSIAREKGIINELKPLFLGLIEKKRYYSAELLNVILKKYGEEEIRREA